MTTDNTGVPTARNFIDRIVNTTFAPYQIGMIEDALITFAKRHLEAQREAIKSKSYFDHDCQSTIVEYFEIDNAYNIEENVK